ncbi:MAG: hypothetical protein Q7R94_00135, partial [bacterium]|nr:hypothetical protein [bacterium]
MIDLKKLVTGFLILASLAGSLSFIFSSYVPTVATSNDIAQINFPSKEPPPLPTNAFVEAIPDYKPQPENTTANSQPPATTPTSNLTEIFTKNLAQDIVETNPQGPLGTDGEFNIAQPDIAVLMKKMESDQVLKKLQIPDWEAEAKAIKFATIESPGEGDVERYGAAIQDIFDKHFIQSGLIGIVGHQSPDDIWRTGILLSEALQDMKGMSVPKELAALHRSGIRVLFYLQSAINLAKNAEDDPMKSMLVFSANEKNYTMIVQDLTNEYLKVKKSGIVSLREKPSGLLAAANSIFGIKTAHAQWIVSDIASWFGVGNDIRVEILKELKKALLTILKQVVVKRLLNQMVSFVQGNGKPLFITNWKSFLEDTYKTIAGAAIGKIVPGLCRPFQPLIRINLQNTFVNGGGGVASSCTLDQIVANIQGFYLNFQTGGWIAYGAVTMPSGNYYGETFWSHSEIARQA